jgi:hypothetical protein
MGTLYRLPKLNSANWTEGTRRHYRLQLIAIAYAEVMGSSAARIHFGAEGARAPMTNVTGSTSMGGLA